MNSFDASRYSISIRTEDTEDGALAVARVAELPDMVVYANSATEAYEDILDVIQTAKEMFDEDNEPFPDPDEPTLEEFSGRLPLRVPKTLHAGLSRQAAKNGTSLNQWCSFLLATQNTIVDVRTEALRLVNRVTQPVRSQALAYTLGEAYIQSLVPDRRTTFEFASESSAIVVQ